MKVFCIWITLMVNPQLYRNQIHIYRLLGMQNQKKLVLFSKNCRENAHLAIDAKFLFPTAYQSFIGLFKSQCFVSDQQGQMITMGNQSYILSSFRWQQW